MSGVMMLPFSLSVSFVSAPTGILISKYGRIRIPIRGWCPLPPVFPSRLHLSLPLLTPTSSPSSLPLTSSVGYAIACLGYGLMNLMDEKSPTAINLIFPLLVGIGIGMSLTPPLQIIQAALKPEEMAAGTSSFLVVRALGATTGIVRSAFLLLCSEISSIPR